MREDDDDDDDNNNSGYEYVCECGGGGSSGNDDGSSSGRCSFLYVYTKEDLYCQILNSCSAAIVFKRCLFCLTIDV